MPRQPDRPDRRHFFVFVDEVQDRGHALHEGRPRGSVERAPDDAREQGTDLVRGGGVDLQQFVQMCGAQPPRRNQRGEFLVVAVAEERLPVKPLPSEFLLTAEAAKQLVQAIEPG